MNKLESKIENGELFHTLRLENEIPNLIATVFFPNHANRLVSCWNACLNLENPETDLPKLIEALKDASQTIRFASNADGIVAQRSIKLIDEALALIKE